MHPSSVVTEGRSWFADESRPARTLRVTAHPDEGVVTLSIWEGQYCRATHRLPLASAPDLIASLAGGLAAAVPLPPRLAAVPPPGDGVADSSGPAARPLARWWRRLLGRAAPAAPRPGPGPASAALWRVK